MPYQRLRQGVAVEMFAHDITGRIPNREQDTLALMVTCPVGVRLAEISERDGPINCREDLR